MEIIKDGSEVLAKILTEQDFHKTQFISADEDSLQVGIFKHDNGSDIVNHVHNVFSRETKITQEMIFVYSGSIEVRIFSADRKLIAKRILKAPSMVYLLSGGHGFTVLEDDTVFFESKNGPYYGVEKDKVKFYE